MVFMRFLSVATFLSCLIFFSTGATARADYYGFIHSEYPSGKFIVGIGETEKSDNSLKDRRITEILARLEVAKHISLRMSVETIDAICDAGAARLFKESRECRAGFKSVVDVTLEWFKKESTIVSRGEREDTAYAVAVMPRVKAVREISGNLDDSIWVAKEFIRRAKAGDRRYLWRAREEYVKARTYDSEKELIDGECGYDPALFKKLETELLKLKEAY
jgi:hypothetical protein